MISLVVCFRLLSAKVNLFSETAKLFPNFFENSRKGKKKSANKSLVCASHIYADSTSLHLHGSITLGIITAALCYVGWCRACSLGHLVILPSAWIVGVIQETCTEILCRQLYHIGKHPRVQPVISEFGYFHGGFFSLLRDDVMT